MGVRHYWCEKLNQCDCGSLKRVIANKKVICLKKLEEELLEQGYLLKKAVD